MGQETQDEETSGKFLNLVVKYVLLFGLEMSIMAPRLLQDLGRLYNQVYVGDWHRGGHMGTCTSSMTKRVLVNSQGKLQ